MNLIDAVKQMSYLQNPSVDTLMSSLQDGYHIITGDKNNYGDDMITYDLYVDDGILFAGRMSDSSSTQIVITIEMAVQFKEEYVQFFWDSYLSGKDFFIVDTMGYMHEAVINTGNHPIEAIKSVVRSGQFFSLNNPYTTPTVDFLPKTNIYIEDNKDAPICGYDAVKVAIETVVNTKIASSKGKADFTIVIMPNTAKPSHHDFFTWYDDESHSLPSEKRTLLGKKLPNYKPYSVLLYWPFNVVLAGLVSPQNAQFKAALELSDRIKEFHSKK